MRARPASRPESTIRSSWWNSSSPTPIDDGVTTIAPATAMSTWACAVSVRTPGFFKADLTVEDVRDNFDATVVFRLREPLPLIYLLPVLRFDLCAGGVDSARHANGSSVALRLSLQFVPRVGRGVWGLVAHGVLPSIFRGLPQ